MKDERERLQELTNKLNLYSYHYHVLGDPIVADVEYDRLYDQLLELEKSTGIVLADSPTLRVGGEIIERLEPHTHINRLYSLDKCNSFDELREWDKKIKKTLPNVSYTLEYKFDGLTLCLTYKDGYLETASTRGDGVRGENVTEQVKTIKSVPQRIEYDGLIEVQGEGIMRLSAFEKYNKTAKEPLKNPRNGVAGAIRNLDTSVTRERNLDAIFYNINYSTKTLASTQAEINDFLKSNRFKTEKIIHSSDIEAIISAIEQTDKSSLDFLIDGMVIKVNQLEERDELGYTNRFPRWAIAYKFEAEETTTRVLDVAWNVGRTGKLTPLALLEPVEIGGATVRRATLNNYGDIQRKKVTKGARVFIRRSNDVIPEILGVAGEEQGEEILKPITCPSCGSEVYEEGAHIFCPNYGGCKSQVLGRLEHFVSKDCMDIEGISGQTIEQLYEKAGVRDIYDLYFVTKEQLQELDGFKDKKINNFIKSIENSKNASLPHYVNALGIAGVGKKTASDLAKIYQSIDGIKNASAAELASVESIGDIMATNIVTFFQMHNDVIEKFKEIGINPLMQAKEQKSGIFSGKKVVFTGKLTDYTRSDAARLVEERGGDVMSSVTKETDIVIVGEDARQKLEKAQKLNKQIMTEQEFKQLITDQKQ